MYVTDLVDWCCLCLVGYLWSRSGMELVCFSVPVAPCWCSSFKSSAQNGLFLLAPPSNWNGESRKTGQQWNFKFKSLGRVLFAWHSWLTHSIQNRVSPVNRWMESSRMNQSQAIIRVNKRDDRRRDAEWGAQRRLRQWWLQITTTEDCKWIDRIRTTYICRWDRRHRRSFFYQLHFGTRSEEDIVTAIAYYIIANHS